MEAAPEEHAEAASVEQGGGCAEAEAEAEGEVEAEHSKKRRARRTKLEVLRTKHAEMLKAIEKLKTKLSDLLAGGRLPTDAALVNITEKMSRKQTMGKSSYPDTGTGVAAVLQLYAAVDLARPPGV